MKEIEVCVIADDGYTIPTAVMLTSLKCNKNPEVLCRVHYISSGIGAFNKSKIKELESEDFKVVFYESDEAAFSDIVIKSHVSRAALLKFNICDILSTVDKVLYVDGDIIVKGDVTELYDIELGNNYAATVRDMGGELYKKFNERIGIKEYFNSGVLLMNLKRMRQDNLSKVLLDTKLNLPATCTCMDQDAFNKVFSGNCVYLPVKYNSMIPLYRNRTYNYSIEQVNEFYGVNYSSYEELDDDSIILHMAGEGRYRPWAVYNGTFGNVWQMYYDKSPYAKMELRRVFYDIVDAKKQPVQASRPAQPKPAPVSQPVAKVEPIKTTKVTPVVEVTGNDAVSGLIKRRIKLFGCIPFVKLIIRDCREDWYLFGCLKLMKVTNRCAVGVTKRKYRLFGFIPVVTVDVR